MAASISPADGKNGQAPRGQVQDRSEEVLADDMTRQVKAGLSNDAGIYLDFDPNCAVGASG